jgi:NAD(P)-dependent dehydrogenase (short-subunit alcohol dehydrogenase family)
MSPVAVLTGAARGIGAATVDRLVSTGWKIVAVDVCADDPSLDYALGTPADLEALGARHGSSVHTMVGDVRSPADMRAAVSAAGEVFGGLDAAVAVAGVVSGGVPLWELGDAQWNVQFDVNVHGVRNLVTAAVPVLLEAPAPRQGRVVAVSSAAGLLGLRRLSGYSASKHAVIGLIKALAPPTPSVPARPGHRSSTLRPRSTAWIPPRSSRTSSWWNVCCSPTSRPPSSRGSAPPRPAG